MSQQQESKPTKPRDRSKGGEPAPVHVIRRGAIAASIWKRQTATGYSYFDFSLSRSWKSASTERTGYSTNFSEKNEQALLEIIQAASVWIVSQGREREQNAAQGALAA